MALEVKNTFFHVNRYAAEAHFARSRCGSAPPSLRTEPVCFSKMSPLKLSSLDTDCSTEASDDGISPWLVPSPTMSSRDAWESDMLEENECGANTEDSDVRIDTTYSKPVAYSNKDGSPLPLDAVQQQLNEMSDSLLKMWSLLSAVEAEVCDDSTPANASSCVIKDANDDAESASTSNKQMVCLADCLSVDQPVSTRPSTRADRRSKLDSKASVFKPRLGARTEIEDILANTRAVLSATETVEAVEIFGALGTIATVSVKMRAGSGESTYLSTAALAKSVLLESASTSQSVYVLGYEANPFVDSPCGIGFAATLAGMAKKNQRLACWETYTTGCCPRGHTCKWMHPGRQEVQPIRFTFE